MMLDLGAKVTKKGTHTIDIALVPPGGAAFHQVRGRDVEDAMNAITTVRDAMTMAAKGDDPWVLSASTIDISFAITQTDTARLQLLVVVLRWKLPGGHVAFDENVGFGSRQHL